MHVLLHFKKKKEQKKNKTQKQTLSFSFTRHSKHLICQTMMLFSTSHILLIVIYFRPSLPQEGSQVTTLQRKKKKSCETVSCYTVSSTVTI